MGLEHSVLFVDCRDKIHEKRFFPIGVEEHLKDSHNDPEWWYTRNQYYNSLQGNLKCCSEKSIAFHYISPHEMYALEYFIYKVHPFGIEVNVNEALPRKLVLKEIITASVPLRA